MEFKKKMHIYIYISVISVLVFLILLYCNNRTPYFADDYVFMYDLRYFSNSILSRITTIKQIFQQIPIHRNFENGRILAHTIVRLLLLIPKKVFNIINSAVFVAEVFLIFRIAETTTSNKPNSYGKVLLYISIFISIWIFQPQFGQVNLWLDGAVNYLWASVLSLAYILLYVKIFFDNEKQSFYKSILLIVVSLFAGAYCENSAIALISFSAFLIISYKIILKNECPKVFYISFIATVIGFASILSAPSELPNKLSGPSIYKYTCNIIDMLNIMRGFLWLWIVAAILLVFAFSNQISKKILVVSSILFICAIVSCACLTVGKYVAKRSLFITVIFLIEVISILFLSLFESNKKLLISLCAVELLIFPYYLSIGIRDLGVTNTTVQENFEYLNECKKNGQLDVPLYYIVADTKYTVFSGLDYLSDNPDSNPNKMMADYYGVNSISIR